MGLPDGMTSENQTLGALWGGWEVATHTVLESPFSQFEPDRQRGC